MENDGLEELIASGVDPATAITASEDDNKGNGKPSGCLSVVLAAILIAAIAAVAWPIPCMSPIHKGCPVGDGTPVLQEPSSGLPRDT